MGLATIFFLLGAAVMYFELPSSDFLAKAFLGARAWNELRQAAGEMDDESSTPKMLGLIDRPGKTQDGYTLYACATMEASSTQAFLINMNREVVHRWSISFSNIWPNPPHVHNRVKDSLVCFFGCHLYANGDLLVVMHGLEQKANGYGLVKLDMDSKVIWKYAKNVHHDVTVGEDGTIYAIQHELIHQAPNGLEFLGLPCLVDYLVMLSPDGVPLREPIPILEAFRDSPYAPILSVLEPPRKSTKGSRMNSSSFDAEILRQDALHTNYVEVLTKELAPAFPLFKVGQVLISMRNLDTIAVLDPETRKIVWAAQGPWKAQHDSQFLRNGNILIFDNQSLPKGSRVLEYDPATQAMPWSYSGEKRRPFYTSERGMSQRLKNGNTLIVNSEEGELLEIAATKEPVWSCSLGRFITFGRRYRPDQLNFLKGGQRARH